MEPFRQAFVDTSIIPLFSRKKTTIQAVSGKDFKKGFWMLSKKWQSRFPYKDACHLPETILKQEALNLKKSILALKSWQPYQYRWDHRWKC